MLTTNRVWALALLAGACLESAHADEGPMLRTWAVLAAKPLQQSGLSDLVTAELSGREGITTVERERLQPVVDELVLDRALGAEGSAERLRLGRILKADALVCLVGQPTAARGAEFQEGVRVVICDSIHGARLRMEWLPATGKERAKLAAEIADVAVATRERYRDGIRSIVAVPPLVSRNLTHDLDHLQQGFAALVETGLSALPGVATVEIDEARSISRELDLSGGDVAGRVVPVVVTGEFSGRAPPGDTRPRLNLRIGMSDGTGAEETVTRDDVDLDAATRFLTTEIPQRVATLTGVEGRVLSPREQATVLVGRADTFAAIGFWDHAVALREAALLLDPQAADQRTRLLRENSRILSEEWDRLVDRRRARTSSPDEDSECCERWVARGMRGLEHVEHLIRHRQVTAGEALGFVRSRELQAAAFFFKDRSFADVAPTIRGYLRHSHPLILKLQAGPRDDPRWLYDAWAESLLDIATSRPARDTGEQGRFGKEDFDFLLELLTQVVPAVSPWSGVAGGTVGLSQFCAGFGSGRLTLREDCPPAEYMAFLRRLEGAGNPHDAATARHGMLWFRWATTTPRGPIEPWLAEARRLEDESANLFPQGPERDMQRIAIRTMNVALGIKPQDSAGRAVATPEQAAPVGHPAAGLPAYEPLALQFADRWEMRPPSSQEGWAVPGEFRIEAVDDAIDLAWTPRSVWLHRRRGVLEQVWAEGNSGVLDVAWDGAHVWIATRSGPLFAVAAGGGVVAQITAEHGLPPCDQGMRLRAIARDTVCAVGSFGTHRRGWCAIVERDGMKGRVKVFHEATRVPGTEAGGHGPLDDPAWTFSPRSIREWRRDGRRTLMVARQPSREAAENGDLWAFIQDEPLLIDVASLAVSVAPAVLPLQHNASHLDRHLLPNGESLTSGGLFVTHIAAPGARLADGSHRRFIVDAIPWSLSLNMVDHGGQVYVPGGTWYRIDPVTLDIVRLGPGVSGLRHASSAHFGIIAYEGPWLYRVDVDKLSLPATLPGDAPIDFRGGSHAGPVVAHPEPAIQKSDIDGTLRVNAGAAHLSVRTERGARIVDFFASTSDGPRRSQEEAIRLRHGIERLLSNAKAITALGISPEQAARLGRLKATRPSLTDDERKKFLALCDDWLGATAAARDAAEERLLAAVRARGERQIQADAEAVQRLHDQADEILSTPDQRAALRRFADGILFGPGY